MKLGKHVSIAGGLDKAPARAKKIGCNCLQIFSKNPRGWKSRAFKKNEIKRLKKEMNRLNMKEIVVHATYLINLASPKKNLWRKSIAGLKEDLERSGQIGAKYLVVHPGSHTGKGKEWGIKRIAEAVNKIFSEVENQTSLLLENVSGAGTTIGSKFSEINDIINRVKNKRKIGVCFDTCHGFAAGYNISTKEGIDKTISRLDKIIGLEYLKVLHVNDSVYELDTNKDEHAHIGQGYIGKEGFKYLINHKKIRDYTFILETPQFEGNSDEDVDLLLLLREKNNDIVQKE
ncbi:MAG: deoxyribonuclease IV [Halothermotrichaceae bacterium]